MEKVQSINLSKAVVDAKRLVEDRQLSEHVRATLRTLIEGVTVMTHQLGIGSHNSSMPPSRGGFGVKKTRESAKGEKRKPGAQAGHKGSTLKKFEDPDEIQELQIDRRTVPKGFYKTVGHEVRQVVELELLRRVVQYEAEIIECSDGQQYVAEFPSGVTQAVQYGESTKAVAVYLSQHQLIPLERVASFFEDQAGVAVSKGSVSRFIEEASDLLVDYEKWAIEQLTLSSLAHADETGINIGGAGYWLHSLSNLHVTLFHPDKQRGHDAMERMGVLPHFQGILCHDHWQPYFGYLCRHALCNAHHLRELEWVIEFEKHDWASAMQKLLVEINTQKLTDRELTEKQQEQYRKRYREILKAGELESPVEPKPEGKRGRVKKTKARNLLERLQNFEVETLLFMTCKDIPFTNNQAERDIRMTKVQQKISGCFRTLQGAKNFCRIRGYLSTCQKNGINAVLALKLLFQKKLPAFMV